ncbi:beta-ketoacyl-[acyl-carrier-protein] synthase family protein [Flavobacteriaceae bacterium TP-CH-4]|uniref:Beta-ketoacyl-[acyl-carrier-protein] synthase family protein n=1 Tax=Pelagihabitans pacificus TaxID=2696054 RepID=A0A967AV79_9FLAO|nr:beta-ketoacyl-[acyl-carrier-protein] synthase family protein [Pelagihabitans pacificus]NHF60562.1 beta-ketoacyl-[acyl-carrier-protein] synthase family protein [Pelagihabitans pacificus]
MGKGVAITGMGIISAIGEDVAENYRSLISGQIGISKISQIETVHKNEIMVGEVSLTNSELEERLGLPKNSWSRTSLLGVIAAKEAVAQAGISDINKERTGLISGTTVGGMDKSEQYFYEYFENNDAWHHINGLHAGDSTQKIARNLGLEESFATTISTACSSAANAIMLGARMIKSGQLDRVVVGGADCLSKFTINGFKTLMILSDTYNTPFDENRKGLNLGEAAAYLVLESDSLVEKEGKEVLGYVKGYGNANDAFHQTASSDYGDGAVLAMEKALKVAGLTPEAIDYVNAHGTATPNNDLSEGRAMLRIFEGKVPKFSSTKAFTGHTLATAGAVEAVYSVLALQNDTIYPNLNFKTPMKEFELVPETELRKEQLNVILSNSFGFGGNCTTLLFSKKA